MPVFLKTITIFNFKSFKGKIIIDFIQPFTAIIGLNGSGKSNIMDAIRFALGEKSSALRVKCLSELIHGAIIEKPTVEGTYVTVVFALDDNTEKNFTRTIYGEGSLYKIDDKIVNNNIYMSELREFGLDIKAENFFIPQNYIECFATKTSKEQIATFEEISGSNVYKADYDRLKLELLEVEEEINFVYQKKRQILMQRTCAMAEKKEAETFLQLQEQYMKEKSKFQLVRLLLIKQRVESLQNEETNIKLRMDEYQHDKESEIPILQCKKSEFKSLSNSVEAIEQSILEKQGVMHEIKMNNIPLEESISYWQKKRDCARVSRDNANQAHETKKRIIQELRDVLKEISNRLAEFREWSQENAVELDNFQIKRYMDLKNEVELRAKDSIKQINSLMKDYQADHDKFENEDRRRQELEDQIKQKLLIEEDLETRLKKLQDLNAEYKATLMEKTKKRRELNEKIIERNNKSLDLEKNIASISEELCQADIDNYNVLQRNRKAEIINMLKQLFSGVYDRLSNLCKSIHPRYSVAITKVFGKNMDAIVVDTNYTAIQCIQVLKQQQICIETFLPLDSIKAEPLKEHLRAINEPKNVKLLYDVLNISSPQINTAVLFVTKNTLVCETAKDARRMAYKTDKYNRYNCVSLDGCFYRKNGIMSGGEVDLVVRAKQWEQQQISALKERKAQLTQTLGALPIISLLQSELNDIDIQINGLNLRKRYMKEEIKDIKNKIIEVHDNLSKLDEKLSALNTILSSLQHNMEETNEKIKDIEKHVNTIKDEIFIDFCKDINVPNISYYEENNLRICQEKKKRQMELEQQYNRIENRLSFENECDTESNISKWKNAVKVANKELKNARLEECSAKIVIEQEEMKMSELKDNYTNMKNNLKTVEKELACCRSRIGDMTVLYLDNQKALIAAQGKIKQKKAECGTVFNECKMEGITIPILSEVMHRREKSSSTSMNSSDLSAGLLSGLEIFAKIDFSQFPEDIRNCRKKELKNIAKQLDEKLAMIQKEFEIVANPNLKADENIDSIARQLRKINMELRKLRKKHNKIKRQFEIVKTNRYKLFSDCLECVSANIDSIYKNLVNDTLAQAFIIPDNIEEPYAGGLIYSCMAPFKCFQPIQYLSGGEQSLASLALLFGFQCYKPTPFFIMDEADAGLDKANIKSLVHFIRSKMVSTRFITITLRREFSSCTDALVGVTTEPDVQCLTSKSFVISLSEYEKKH